MEKCGLKSAGNVTLDHTCRQGSSTLRLRRISTGRKDSNPFGFTLDPLAQRTEQTVSNRPMRVRVPRGSPLLSSSRQHRIIVTFPERSTCSLQHASGRHPGKSRYVGRAAIAADCNPVSLRFESGTYLHSQPAQLALSRAERSGLLHESLGQITRSSLFSPDQRARRSVPASGSPGSASHHHLLCLSAGRRCAAVQV